MSLRPFVSFVCFVGLSLCAFSAPTEISRADALRLHVALESIAPGLNPANAITAADNLTALEPAATALRKAHVALQRAQARLPDAPDRQERAIRLAEELDAAAEQLVTLDLLPLPLTPDEIREAKIQPAHLSLLRRYLAPKK